MAQIRRDIILVAVFFLLSGLCAAVPENYKEHAYALYNYLMDPSAYKSTVIPVSWQSSNISITMQLQLLSIVAVDEKEQTLVTNTRLFMTWSDAYLAWERQSYGNLTSILLGQDRIWLPDIIVANTVEPSTEIGFPGLPCRVFYTGEIEWNPGVIIYSSCDLDVTYFPMDTQVCHIMFETMASWFEEVQIKVNDAVPIVLDNFKQNGQWDVLDVWGNHTDGSLRNIITFSFLLQRRRAYYLLNIMIPVFLLSLTGTLAFALPADAGEKMGMCLTVLLSYTVYLTIVSEELPNTSLQISVLSVYLTVLIAITTVTVGMTTIILRLHHKPETEEVGPGTQKLVQILKQLTCRYKQRSPRANSVVPLFVRAEINKSTGTDTKHSQKTTSTDLRSESSSTDDPDTLTWQEVAKTLDCFLFMVMTSISIACSIATLAVLLVGSETHKPILIRT